MAEDIDEIYIIGHRGPEHNHIESIHKTYDGAIKAWNKLRNELINDARKMKYFCIANKYDYEDYNLSIDKLHCEDPEKIDNYPHETPYIEKWKVEG